ncbi:receptor-like protein EIX2 [Humulus lupulus]|uniref:receptor-like protein EIX2 n=1 Tax=Humulus lupulus TaxID=3486 RepID=UPI002B408967|nr:receptor-like protein EIX2 [Humulus lupulus]
MGRYHSTEMISFLVLLYLCISNTSGTTFGCIERERQALLHLKHSFQDISHKLSSWEGEDCCQWKGVGCNEGTGHVVKLDLRSSIYYDYFTNYSTSQLPDLQAREVSSCLLELQHLNYLDLSGNNFSSSKIPNFFGSMKNLKYLNLSYANFGGRISLHFGNLTILQVLDLQGLSSVSTHTFQWASNLLSLQYLDMNHVNCRKASDFMQVLTKLPSLSHISLSSCDLDMVKFAYDPINSTFSAQVRYLDLSMNTHQRSILHDLQNMTSLEVLDLSSTFYSSSSKIPSWLGDFKSLVYLNLASNNYDTFEEGGLLYIINNACSLKLLDLSFNSIGHVLEPHPNSTQCVKYNLELLNLSGNQVSGPLPDWLEQLESLKNLDLSGNLFHGPMPSSLVRLSFLEVLDRIVSEDLFANLTRLKKLVINSNNFSCKFNSEWIPPFSLNLIHMGSCKVEGPHEFPQWLQTQREATELNISNANIVDTFPNWHHIMSSLSSLDLSMNKISGHLPMNIDYTMPSLESLNLGNNLINGSIPDSICELESLQNLDLSRNKLSGILPHWRESQEVIVINLSYNNLSGTIPSSIGNLSYLKWLHLNNNNLSGELPLALTNCSDLLLFDVGYERICLVEVSLSTFAMKILDLAGNNLSGKIPRCFGNLSGMTVGEDVIVAYEIEWDTEKVSQVMKGRDLEYTKILLLLDNLDLSSNKLVGVIPEELCMLSALRGLNLSHNHLSGNIPNRIGELKSLESLDLSNNKLFGAIPQSMSNLMSLNKLGLAHNNFSGKIPTGDQLQTMDDPEIYVGNDQLCGLPLPKKCPGDDDRRKTVPMSNGHEDDDYKESRSERIWFYFVVTLGYAVGLWGVIGSLVFKRKWRHACFRFTENTKDWIVVTIQVNIGRFKKSIMKWTKQLV